MSTSSFQASLLPSSWMLDLDDLENANLGEFFTRRWVVEAILDLVGFVPTKDLSEHFAIEPACGSGAFLVPMVNRLVESCQLHGRSITEAEQPIVAFDLLEGNVTAARAAVYGVLSEAGLGQREARQLTEEWIVQADFLLDTDFECEADFVIGNPPYVRLEDVSAARAAAYRTRCRTMSGRADLFVGFFELGLRALRPDGRLGFICADRWMHNQYGRALRSLIADSFSLDASIVMHDVDAFEDSVSAYPAITVIRRGDVGPSLIGDTTADFGPESCRQLLNWYGKSGPMNVKGDGYRAAIVDHPRLTGEPWPSGPPEVRKFIVDLEARFPPLEESAEGTRVGIGVATGADQVFITDEEEVAESDRLLPLSMVADTQTGVFSWSGHYLVNPWSEEGGLVRLDDHPRMRNYLESHKSALAGRHVAKKNADRWYRTIDPVRFDLTRRPKLLLPDMKMTMSPVLESGGFYPHHNLYYVVSDSWDLRVLGGLLMSELAETFIRAYAVKMRGGTLRFQAQYLRRIRVPRPEDLSDDVAKRLAEAFEERDRNAATLAASEAYGVPVEDFRLIWGSV